MELIDRRNFLRAGLAASLCGFAGGEYRTLEASPYGLPVGLELYTVRDQLKEDFAGTLSRVAAIGYKQVELSGFYGKTASELKRLFALDGLTCSCAHYGLAAFKSQWEEQIEYAQRLGLRYMVLSSFEPSMPKSIDDCKRAAEFLNKTGEQCNKAGMQFAYHNHNVDFEKFNGVVSYDVMLQNTDAALVHFEMDCFWVTRAGYDPVAYMNKYPGRFPLLHIKDERHHYPPTATGRTPRTAYAPVGRGIIDWKRIFKAARRGGLKYYYVEQDLCKLPPLEAIRISYNYLHKLTV